MKTLLRISLAMALMGIFAGCDNSEDFELENATLSKQDEGKMRTLGFNVLLYGTYDFQGLDEKCPGLIMVRNIGEGTGTHFKKVTSYFEFCVKPVPGGGGTYPEGYIDAYFEDENGDRLYVEVAGQVIPGRVPGMPNYAMSYFKDPFTIIGGTGHFEDATGSGYTNDYNFVGKDGEIHTSHHWQGTITLKK